MTLDQARSVAQEQKKNGWLVLRFTELPGKTIANRGMQF
jgi:hypothetical protein